MALWTGLTLGSIYALVALGYNIVFAATGIFNFAHAALLVSGVFTAYWARVVMGWSWFAVFLVAIVVVAVIAFLEERLAIRPLMGKDSHSALITTVGVSVILEGIIFKVWGTDPHPVPFFGSDTPFRWGTLVLMPVEITLVIMAIVATLLVHILSTRTRVGLASRATTEDREAATLRGVNTAKLSILAFIMAGVIAGLAGPMIGPKTFAVSTIGLALALKGFVSVAIGGFGSYLGSLLGAMILGIVEATGALMLGSAYQNLIVFSLLLAVLMVRPRGLFGDRAERVV